MHHNLPSATKDVITVSEPRPQVTWGNILVTNSLLDLVILLSLHLEEKQAPKVLTPSGTARQETAPSIIQQAGPFNHASPSAAPPCHPLTSEKLLDPWWARQYPQELRGGSLISPLRVGLCCQCTNGLFFFLLCSEASRQNFQNRASESLRPHLLKVWYIYHQWSDFRYKRAFKNLNNLNNHLC